MAKTDSKEPPKIIHVVRINFACVEARALWLKLKNEGQL
jgi:hypothetical protein